MNDMNPESYMDTDYMRAPVQCWHSRISAKTEMTGDVAQKLGYIHNANDSLGWAYIEAMQKAGV